MTDPATTSALKEDQRLLDLFGAHYWTGEEPAKYEAPSGDSYFYECFIGKHDIHVERGDTCYCVSAAEGYVSAQPGPINLSSEDMAIVMRGYMAPPQTYGLKKNSALPYVNGCSTRQLLPPQRPGDPTFQSLTIPPFSAEQAHHIHSTVRCVYVLSGKGRSIVGMEGRSVTTELLPGMVCVLDPMSPHHFDTPQGEWLHVLPFHVFSTVPGAESNHPMFNGTFLMNQGE